MTSTDDSSDSAPPLPEERIGAAMRQARELRGISLRQTAKQLGYHSHTTLSSYERGAVMPTDEVVTGYERLLALEQGALTSVLEQARIERHGDAWAKRRAHLPRDFGQTNSADGKPGLGRIARSGWPLNWQWSVAVGGVLVLGLAVLLVVVLRSGDHKATPSPASLIGVRDGSDPKVTGCLFGAIVASSVDVFYPPQHLIGTLQLRSSARCGTSWGRFVPMFSVPQSPPWQVVVNVYRPADGAVSRYQTTYNGVGPAYGNMLISRHACVYATLTLQQKGRPRSAIFQTTCREAPGA